MQYLRNAQPADFPCLPTSPLAHWKWNLNQEDSLLASPFSLQGPRRPSEAFCGSRLFDNPAAVHARLLPRLVLGTLQHRCPAERTLARNRLFFASTHVVEAVNIAKALKTNCNCPSTVMGGTPPRQLFLAWQSEGHTPRVS